MPMSRLDRRRPPSIGRAWSRAAAIDYWQQANLIDMDRTDWSLDDTDQA